MRRTRRWYFIPLLALTVVHASAAGDAIVEVEARRLLAEGEAALAVSRIEATSNEERDAELWFLLAEGYHTLMDEAGILNKRGLAKKMRRALESALEIEPAHVRARRELADFYFYAPWVVGGNKDEAARQLETLERIAPAEAHATRGEHARNAGDLKAARDHFRKALQIGPREAGTLFALAVVEQQLNHYAESIRLVDELIEIEPAHEEAYYYRARASAMSGLEVGRGLECAEHYLEQCIECDDTDRGFGWWRRATLLKRMERTDAAIAAYREALRFNSELESARKELEELKQ